MVLSSQSAQYHRIMVLSRCTIKRGVSMIIQTIKIFFEYHNHLGPTSQLSYGPKGQFSARTSTRGHSDPYNFLALTLQSRGVSGPGSFRDLTPSSGGSNHVHDLITPPPPSQGQDLKVSPHGCSFGEHKSRSHTRSRDFSHDRRGNYKSPSNSGQKSHDLTSDNFSTIGGESTIIVATRKLYEVN